MISMLHGVIMTLKKAIVSFWLFILMTFGLNPVLVCESRLVIKDPKRVLDTYRGKFHEYVQDINSKVRKLKGCNTFLGNKFTGFCASFFAGYTEEQLKNAGIIWRFFSNPRFMDYIYALGSPEDMAYVSAVFTEFYASPNQNFDRLIHIMHQRMMDALGFERSTSLKKFLGIIEQTNRKGHYVNIHGPQFDAYCHMIALNLFVSFCFRKNIGVY